MLSIVICVYNKYNFTKSCLNDLFRLPEKDYEIILIDNASSDETEAELSKINRKNFIYVRNTENLFHSKACNIGYHLTTGKYVLFLNNDIRIKSNHTNWPESLIKHCDKAIVGSTMGQLDNKLNFVQEANKQLSGNCYLSGWCIASSKENWNKLDIGNEQIWNERYPFYFNDTDLAFRCKKIGLEQIVISLPVAHFGQISAKQVNVRKLYNDGRAIFLEDWNKERK
jgi:GT2 family glycosyltransferase